MRIGADLRSELLVRMCICLLFVLYSLRIAIPNYCTSIPT